MTNSVRITVHRIQEVRKLYQLDLITQRSATTLNPLTGEMYKSSRHDAMFCWETVSLGTPLDMRQPPNRRRKKSPGSQSDLARTCRNEWDPWWSHPSTHRTRKIHCQHPNPRHHTTTTEVLCLLGSLHNTKQVVLLLWLIVVCAYVILSDELLSD